MTKAKKAKKSGKGVVKKFMQGRLVMSFYFFKKNWLYVVCATIMMLAYIANRFECQKAIEQVSTLSADLNNARTDFVKQSAKYNSIIRESQMKGLIDSAHIDLESPEQPPYLLSSTK